MRIQVQLQHEMMQLSQNMKSLQEENVRLRVQPMEERESKYSTPPDGRSLEKSLRSIDKHMDQRKKGGLESSKPKEDGSRDRKEPEKEDGSRDRKEPEKEDGSRDQQDVSEEDGSRDQQDSCEEDGSRDRQDKEKRESSEEEEVEGQSGQSDSGSSSEEEPQKESRGQRKKQPTKEAFDAMLKLMQGMQRMQEQLLTHRGKTAREGGRRP